MDEQNLEDLKTLAEVLKEHPELQTEPTELVGFAQDNLEDTSIA